MLYILKYTKETKHYTVCIYRYIDRLVTCGPDFCGPKLTHATLTTEIVKTRSPRMRTSPAEGVRMPERRCENTWCWTPYALKVLGYHRLWFIWYSMIHVMWCVCLWLDDVAIWWKYSLPSNPAAPWPDINLKDVVLPAPFTPKRPKTIPFGVGWRPVPGDINS